MTKIQNSFVGLGLIAVGVLTVVGGFKLPAARDVLYIGIILTGTGFLVMVKGGKSTK